MNAMEPAVDWAALERLRDGFLQGTAGSRDYWQSWSDLASYDATFAQRIGWKWDFVLRDLARGGWIPPEGEVLDWGCGSGIASRAFLDHFGASRVSLLRLEDRSALAMKFAAETARGRFPGLGIHTGGAPEGRPPAVLLLSHVATELNEGALSVLREMMARSTAVLWVEPGTPAVSAVLVRMRESLRDRLHPVAPCLHTGACGLLEAGNASHWCHQFAAPPPEVFTDPFWTRFGRLLGLDLRSLPLSYLVLDQRAPSPAPPPPSRPLRILGRPRVLKPEVRLMGCDATGVREHVFSRREYPGLWRDAKKERLPAILDPSGSKPA